MAENRPDEPSEIDKDRAAERAEARAKAFREHTRWRLIPRVQDIGFFQGLLESRARLVTAAVGGTGLALLVIYFVSGWMRTSSGSSMLNVFIIAVTLTGLIVAAYIDALLAGDSFFPGKWRERVLAGDRYVPEDWEEEQAAVKEYNAPFLFTMLGIVLVLAYTAQLVSNGFISWYQNVGFSITLMRSDDPQDRYLGLESIVNPLHEAYWQDPELHEQVALLVDDPEPEVQQIALYAAGRLGVSSAGEDMLRVFRESPDGAVRGAAAMALGRLHWEKALPYMASRLKAGDADEAERLGIVRGLGMMEDARGGPAVARMLAGCDAEAPSEVLVTNGFYALRGMAYTKGSKIALEYLSGTRCEDEVPRVEQCAAADALRFIAEKRHIDDIQRHFRDVPMDAKCDYAMWRYREEKSLEIVEAEPLRAKFVRAVGNRKEYSTYEWMWAIGADESEDTRTRKIAEVYVREMLEAYNRENATK